MAIDINISSVSTAAARELAVSSGDTTAPQAAKTAAVEGKVLNVTNGAYTDLEKLVAQIKDESKNTRQSIAQRRIAILTTVLDAMAERVSEEEKAYILKLEEMNCQIDEENANIANTQSQKAAQEALSAELEAKIKALENAIENEKKNGEDHRKQIEELKKQKAEVDAKIQTLENAIASAQTKVAGLESEVAALSTKIGTSTLGAVSAAIREAAVEEIDVSEKHETNAEKEKVEKKAEETDVAKAISKALKALDDEIMRTIEQSQVVKA